MLIFCGTAGLIELTLSGLGLVQKVDVYINIFQKILLLYEGTNILQAQKILHHTVFFHDILH